VFTDLYNGLKKANVILLFVNCKCRRTDIAFKKGSYKRLQ